MSFKLRDDHIQILIIILLILLILPFFILCFFNHPCPEDMSWTENTHRNGFIRSQISALSTEGGRYFTYALLSLNPLILHSITGYKILIFLMMAALLIVLYFFVKQIFGNVLSKPEKFLISLSLIFLYFYGMPSVSEGFYYLTGVALYNLSLILLMLFCVYVIKIKDDGSGRNNFKSIVACTFLFLTVLGSCELAIVLMTYLIIILFLNDLINNKKVNKLWAFFILLILISGLILYFSPGNVHRSDKYSLRHEFINSAYNSFAFTMSSIYYWIFKTPLSGISVLLLPVFISFYKRSAGKEILQSSVFKTKLYITLPCSVLILTSLNFIIFFTINIIPYYRIQNFIYFIFLLLWFYNLLVLSFYLSEKFKFSISDYSKYIYLTGSVVLVLFLFRKNNNIRTAYSELIRGTASEYDSRMNERYNIIYNCTSDSCLVDSIKNVPKTLGEVQLTSDPMSNFNRWYSRYFHKKYIYLK